MVTRELVGRVRAGDADPVDARVNARSPRERVRGHVERLRLGSWCDDGRDGHRRAGVDGCGSSQCVSAGAHVSRVPGES